MKNVENKSEIVVNLKETKVSSFQRIINILSMVAIPIILGVSGFYIQQEIEQQKIQQEYIKIALSVINDEDKVQPDILDWAVDVLVKHSDPPLPEKVAQQLKDGKTSIYSKTDRSVKSESKIILKPSGPSNNGTIPHDEKWATPGTWFTVLASYPASKEKEAKSKKKELEELLKKEKLKYEVKIYMTKISKHYAVTIGGELTKPEAVSLAKLSRKKGLASDAFAQINREWYLINETK